MASLTPRFRAVCFISILALISVVATAGAEPVRIIPKLSLGMQTDSNFYADETREREVYNYFFRPGFEARYETARTETTLSYTLNAEWFDDAESVAPTERAANDQDYVGHDAGLEFVYTPVEGLNLGLDAVYARTLETAVADQLTEDVDKNKLSFVRLTPVFEYELGRDGRLTTGARYRTYTVRYDDAANEGASSHQGIFDAFYAVTPMISVGAEYTYGVTDYDAGTSDYTTQMPKLVLRFERGIFSAEAGVGYNYRSFEQHTTADIDTTVYHASLGVEGASTKVEFDSQLDYNNLAPYYTAHRIGLTVSHDLTERLSIEVGTSYQNSSFETETGRSENDRVTLIARKDNSYRVVGSVGYKFTDWLTFTVEAGHDERESNVLQKDYQNSYFVGQLEIGYTPPWAD